MPNHRLRALAAAILTVSACASTVNAKPKKQPDSRKATYYTGTQLFSTAPREDLALQSIDRFGPVGIGIELIQPAFRMRIKNVEKDSPAAATGTLKQGQLIDSINGRVLAEVDPRIILGEIIAKAEATDGVVTLTVRDNESAEPRNIAVTIPVLGAYNDTWPLNCPKSDAIVRNLAAYLKRTKANGMGLGALFLMSTGDPDDLETVRAWMQERIKADSTLKQTQAYPWHAGYGGPALCEYFLRTGDDGIMHSIQLMVDRMEQTIYNDAWGHRGVGSYAYMSGGHMNAAGVHVLTFMMLAKECGANVNDRLLHRALRHFFRFAGKGNTPYGDGRPEPGYVDNGKTGGLAFAMQAAAALTPQGEQSVYAKARDISALKSFYSTSWMLHGHTGGGIGEIWRGAAMGLIHRKKPHHYRQFMDHRAWFYDLSRRHDGSFGILGGGRYDAPNEWAIGMGLAYTVPRRTLRMTGAPATAHGRHHQLPDRPWGTAADDAFYAIDPSPTADGTLWNHDAETLARHSSKHLFALIGSPETDTATLQQLAHHPDIGIRKQAIGALFKRTGDAMVLPLLNSPDPRVRAAAIGRIETPDDAATDRLLEIVNDPDESLWVVLKALEKLADAPPARLEPHIARFTHWLQHEEWWMRQAALKGLSNVATDKRFYRQILPLLASMQAANTRAALIWSFGDLVKNLKNAAPDVLAFALDVFGQAYLDGPRGVLTASGEPVTQSESTISGAMAWQLTNIPGGYDRLYEVATQRYPRQTLPHKELFLKADTSRFSGKLREGIRRTIIEEMIPQFIATGYQNQNRKLLLQERDSAPWKGGFYYRNPRMEDLVALFQRAGIHDYDWADFGPAPDAISWRYHTFDPKDGKLFGGTRYRDVACPEGMADWFAPKFDPDAAGWKTGYAPFGQKDGKLITDAPACRFDFCRCGTPMQTFWDQEVLLMRAGVTFPPFKEGYRYRLVVGGMSHVNSGEGYRIYINGKKFAERNRGVGKREGAKPICRYIDKAWWPEFQKPDVTVAAITFLKHNSKTNRPEQHLSIWFQQMKTPPLDDTVMLETARIVPLKCAEWQALQDPERPEFDPAEGLYRWDGTLTPNPRLDGPWKAVGIVARIEAFKPGARLKENDRLPDTLTFRANGRTDDPLLFYTGETLMDLRTNQALTMRVRTIDGADYLFVENGGFDAKHGAAWKPTLCVMKRN